MDITIKGLESVFARLDKFGNDNLAGELVNRLALNAQAVAKGNCPVNTGDLRNSIVIAKPTPLTARIVALKEYAMFVEYGTGVLGDPKVAHTQKEHWSYQSSDGKWHTSHGQSPQPFMQPAVMAVRTNADELCSQVIKEYIK